LIELQIEVAITRIANKIKPIIRTDHSSKIMDKNIKPPKNKINVKNRESRITSFENEESGNGGDDVSRQPKRQHGV